MRWMNDLKNTKIRYGIWLFLLGLLAMTVGCGTSDKVPEYDGYTLLWNDEFDGERLDENIWNYEPHQPGWTNAELQEYTTSEENVFLKDGKLVIKAIKTQSEAGRDYYTSGKVTTKGKKDFKYGKVVARAKVPKGKGLWPAIWMMPTQQSLYGNWPKCGEIDIMEVLCDNPDTAYGTIHYGVPHGQQQGKVVLQKGDFSEGFHEYCVEWDPGEMNFYIDGECYLTVNDWFTAPLGGEEKPYPAPFNQDFFVQMNLAVGGTWPGNPDETTDFENAEFQIDYVRVYQREQYDENVKKPVKVFREALADGNLIYNGDFAENESLDDMDNWSFLQAVGGKGSVAIENGCIAIATEDKGSEDYSIQLVQSGIALRKGESYRLSFEACADADREGIVCVSAPDLGYARYLEDVRMQLTSQWQEFTYEFTMTGKDDNNGRLEFNLGDMGSTATVRIRNVRLE